MDKPSHSTLYLITAVAVLFILGLLVFFNVVSALAGITGIVLGYAIAEVDNRARRREIERNL